MAKKFMLIIISILSFRNIFSKQELKGIYCIYSNQNNQKLIEVDSTVSFIGLRLNLIIGRYYFRIIKKDFNLYYSESVYSNRILAVDDTKLILIDKNENKNTNNIYWNFIKIKKSEYLIQNINTQKFLMVNHSSAKCSKYNLHNKKKKKYKYIASYFRFKLIKLYEEGITKEENMKFIDEEPVDVVIKYIDLSDKTLNRTGIHQVWKDKDHEELRYSVRSIFENIPWFRKIFIVMPNDKVRYFKSQEEIKDRIVYLKDKDVIGFDTANSLCFQQYLWNLKQFNVSDNIILMDDDYFIGKPIKKSDFFYYDEKLKKVLPNLVSVEFKDLNKDFVYNRYNSYFSRKESIDPHSSKGWCLQTYTTFKFFFDNYPEPLIDAGFTHNALSININYVKEIYDLIRAKYKFSDEILYSKQRTPYDIQFQTFYNLYTINIKKGKAHSIPRVFYDLKQLRKSYNLDIELFVINTSGDINYTQDDFENLKNALKQKFPNPTQYELDDRLLSQKIINNFLFSFAFILIILSLSIIAIVKLYNTNQIFIPLKYVFTNIKKMKKIYDSEEKNVLNKI